MQARRGAACDSAQQLDGVLRDALLTSTADVAPPRSARGTGREGGPSGTRVVARTAEQRGGGGEGGSEGEWRIPQRLFNGVERGEL